MLSVAFLHTDQFLDCTNTHRFSDLSQRQVFTLVLLEMLWEDVYKKPAAPLSLDHLQSWASIHPILHLKCKSGSQCSLLRQNMCVVLHHLPLQD